MAVRGSVRFKADDIWEAPEDGNRYEVIDGELLVTPAPSWGHQVASAGLFLRLGTYVRRRRLGQVVSAPTGVALDEETAVQPDLVYVSRERAGIISERGLEGAPNLVVEVLSPSTQARDRGIKMRRYAAAGIPHYWLVDPSARTLEPYRLGERGYESGGVYGAGTTFRPELFPGLEIPIDELWS
ncbi:MAG TPA: Uma2 family endonuclease [Chloroflexota bacterium]|nr:Uma2 family endonuclease [Chloroflexota bacterium]